MASPVCLICKDLDNSNNTGEVHSIPCRLHFDGPAPVSGYFIQQEHENAKRWAVFRGHGLEGITLNLPSGYELYVLKKRADGVYDIESRRHSFLYWEWDREAGATVLFGGGVLWTFQNKIKCRLYECCDRPYVSPRFDNLHRDLHELVYGQHLVLDTVENSIRAHWTNERPKKPLVMSFHGFTGSGKNYVAEIIANNTFKNGMKSSFVHHIVATTDFPDSAKINEYKLKLRNKILEGVRKCSRALFIFDEADKLPEQLLEAIKPFLDYYDSVSGVDFRKSTFLFLSNRGGNVIANIILSHYQAGKPRDDLTLSNFERMLMQASYNEPGGLKFCDLISNHLVDHFVPFLPLERQHVILCAISYLKSQGRADLAADDELVQSIADSLQYFPREQEIFSSSGCKRIAAKADLEISKRILPSLAIRHLNLDDEL
ncbi:Torsin [Dictyocaulus viviparus]|uniref:Torsin n=1 Tax=Dictyocaulus viviparus TaxID=29172 RepID=A0A0D8Y7Z2_DICVI|nr:Torsin [Dictyocaulus viviparus]